MNERALAIRHSMGLQPIGQQEWGIMREQATVLVKTGFLPDAIKTPEQAIAIMMKGRELSLPAMYALSNIVVIKGKPTANAELMLALVYRDHGDDAIRFAETTNERCTISYKRRNWTSRESYSFTIQDAQTAGLAQGATWKAYPAAMLRARCISAVARLGFPDSIGGMYTPEELGATVHITETGETEVLSLPNGMVDRSTGEIIEQEPKRNGTPPPVVEPESDAEIDTLIDPHAPTCHECHEPVRAVTINGKPYTVDAIVDTTVARYGHALCAACSQKRRKAG